MSELASTCKVLKRRRVMRHLEQSCRQYLQAYWHHLHFSKSHGPFQGLLLLAPYPQYALQFQRSVSHTSLACLSKIALYNFDIKLPKTRAFTFLLCFGAGFGSTEHRQLHLDESEKKFLDSWVMPPPIPARRDSWLTNSTVTLLPGIDMFNESHKRAPSVSPHEHFANS